MGYYPPVFSYISLFLSCSIINGRATVLGRPSIINHLSCRQHQSKSWFNPAIIKLAQKPLEKLAGQGARSLRGVGQSPTVLQLFEHKITSQKNKCSPQDEHKFW
ncbi:MAG: hypothetical protein FWG68_01790 [Defluviitaleaceae bacterium]|nr:hypothetical protein [Defluviitaleaceae bacterium]